MFFKDTHDYRHVYPPWFHRIDLAGAEGTPELFNYLLRFLFLDGISCILVGLDAHFNFAIWFYFVRGDT